MDVFDFKEFVFRCNKVLPTEYDDALSYYEVLGKVATHLNNVIDATNALADALVSPYDSNVSYAVGDYVWYNEAIWKCTNTNYGGFNPSDWGNEPVVFIESVGNDIIDFKSFINTIVENQQSLIERTIEGIAPAYDETTTYNVGDYVSYISPTGGIIYKCIDTTTGSFDSDKWNEVVVIEELFNYVGELWRNFIDNYMRTIGVDQLPSTNTTDAISTNGYLQSILKIVTPETVVDGAHEYAVNLASRVGERIWYTYGNQQSYIIPLHRIYGVSITNNLHACRYVFLKTLDGLTDGGTMDSPNNQAWTEIAYPNKTYLRKPADANYIAIWKQTSTGDSVEPDEIKLFSLAYKNAEINYSGEYEVNFEALPYITGALTPYSDVVNLNAGKLYIKTVDGFKGVAFKSTKEVRYAFVKDSIFNGSKLDNEDGDKCTIVNRNADTRIVSIPQWAKYILIWKTNSLDEDTTPDYCALLTENSILYQSTQQDYKCENDIFNIDLRHSENYTDVVGYNSANITDNGYSCSVGYNNKIKIEKTIVSDVVSYSADITISTGASFVLGTVDANFTGITNKPHASCIEFDFGNAIAKFRTSAEGGANFNGEELPSYVYASTPIENINGNLYRIEIGRIKRCPYLRVRNKTTGALCCELLLSEYYTFSGYSSKAGALYDYPVFACLSGTVTVHKIRASVPKADVVFLGDSVTEGSQLHYEHTWAYFTGLKYKSFLNIARGGGTILHCLRAIDDIVSVIKPKICIVTIGGNGGNTVGRLDLLVDKIESLGCKAIVNNIPRRSSTPTHDADDQTPGSDAYINAQINALQVDRANFDVATSIEHNIQNSQNTLYYLNDETHPNIYGSQALYRCFMSAIPVLYD